MIKSTNNSKTDIENYESKHLKIRGAKSRHCFIGVLFLIGLTLCIFWLYSYLENESNVINPSEINSESIEIEEETVENAMSNQIRLTPTIDISQGKYEFRAAWLASVNNLDYPKAQNMSTDELKANFLKILDVYELYNLNAVIMQVRPEGDALYLSQLNPPSRFVTGDTSSPLPFDLLEYAITQTHKRGLEFHAWFNPFRVRSTSNDATTDEVLNTLHADHFARKNPNLVLRFENQLFLNIGEPKVIDFIHQSIMEVVRNYDVDAIHLDDYFYPYASQQINEEGEVVPLYFGDNDEDLATYEKEGQRFTDIKEWRRNNTYQFIRNLSHDIHDAKPYVQLGISPFGIWGHNEETQGLGSNTPVTSQETYNHSVFADTRRWINEDLIDYVIPQIYWSRTSTNAPYEELASWWNDVVKNSNVNLYIGHGTYKLYESIDEPWRTTNVIREQISFNKTLDQVKGSAFFRFSYLLPENSYFNGQGKDNLRQHTKELKEDYTHMAIIPRSEHLAAGTVTSPKDVKLSSNILTFSEGNDLFGEENLTKAFLIYQFPKDDLDCENPAYLFRKIVVEANQETYSLNSLDSKNYTYGVSALNRLHQESNIVIPSP